MTKIEKLRGYLFLTAVGLGFSIYASGCGYKYPMPPIPSDSGMPPESSYVSTGIWDSSAEFNDLFVGISGLVFAIRNDSVLAYYLSGARNNNFDLDYEFQGAVSGVQALDGSIWVLDTSSAAVMKFSQDGNLQRTIIKPEFVGGVSIAIRDSLFYISFRDNNLVVAYDTLGNVVDTVAREGNGILNVVSPVGLYYDRQRDLLFVASSGHNWVEGITASLPHENLYHLGGIYHDGGTDDTLFLNPLDVTADLDGNVYVADSGNAAVKKFSPSGEFIISAYSRIEGAYPLRVAVSFTGSEFYAIMGDGNMRWIEKFNKAERPDTTGGGK